MNLLNIKNKVAKFLVSELDVVQQNCKNLKIIDSKDGGADIATNFDREIEEKFYNFVKKEFPGMGFRGEEFEDLKEDKEYTWFIDPIDGTKYFANGISLWSSTLSLIHKDKPIIGLIYLPYSTQLYSAIEGEGAFLNDKKVKIAQEINLSKLQASMDMAKTKFKWNDYTDDFLAQFSKIAKEFYRVRMFGSGALSLAWLANNFLGAYIDPLRPKEKLVDVMAGHLICKEAGAEVFIEEMENEMYRSIVAHPNVLKQVKKILGW